VTTVQIGTDLTEAEKDQEKEGQDKTSNSLFNMMMSNDIRKLPL